MMAALVKHGIFKTLPTKSTTNALLAGFATKAEKKKGIDRKIGPKIDSSAKSIAAKGFLRPQRAYAPPNDVKRIIDTICKQTLINDSDIKQNETRFKLFTACAEKFDHSIPNSLLHSIQSVKDLTKFYETPISTVTPLEALKSMDLPKNLHVQHEYRRFHPDTDTKFNGQTAFNRSSTLVTGLKYKGKYAGHNQNQEWPFNS